MLTTAPFLSPRGLWSLCLACLLPLLFLFSRLRRWPRLHRVGDVLLLLLLCSAWLCSTRVGSFLECVAAVQSAFLRLLLPRKAKASEATLGDVGLVVRLGRKGLKVALVVFVVGRRRRRGLQQRRRQMAADDRGNLLLSVGCGSALGKSSTE